MTTNDLMREANHEGWSKLELNAISMFSAKVDAISQRLERLNVNFIN